MLFKKKKKNNVLENDNKEALNAVDFEEDSKDEAKIDFELDDNNDKKEVSKQTKINPLKDYKFWIKIFSAILLVILGFILLFKENDAKAIVLMFTGGVFVLYSIIRFVPLIKTLEKGTSKLLAFFEIVFDLIVGILLIYLSAKNLGDKLSGFAKWSSDHFNILIAFVLWLRGFVYFTSAILFKERTDKAQYYVHIAIITFGSYLFGVKIDASKIAFGLAIVSLICAVVIAGEGGYEYFNYRNKVKVNKVPKKDSKKENKKDAPAKEQDKQIDENIINQEIIDPKDDRPYIS